MGLFDKLLPKTILFPKIISEPKGVKSNYFVEDLISLSELLD